MKNYILTILVLVASTQLIAGGPWLNQEGHGFFQLQSTFQAYKYQGLIMEGGIGDIQPINRKVISHDYGLLGDYGISDKVNLQAYIPFKTAVVSERTDSGGFATTLPEGRIAGLSNLAFGVKFKLLDTLSNWKAAITLNTQLNTVESELSKGLVTGIPANAFGVKAHFGRGFGSKWYSFLEGGYSKFTNGYSDVVNVFWEAGYRINGQCLFILSYDLRNSLENGTYYNENQIQTGLFPNDQEWGGIGLKFLYENENGFGFNLATAAGVTHARYVGFAGPITLGVFKKI